MRDEADRLTCKAPFGHRRHIRMTGSLLVAMSMGMPVTVTMTAAIRRWSHILMRMRMLRHRRSICLGALAHHAEIVRCAGRFEMDFAFEASIIDPIQRVFVLITLEHDRFIQTRAAANRH